MGFTRLGEKEEGGKKKAMGVGGWGTTITTMKEHRFCSSAG